MNFVNTINEQIKSCRELLSIFQGERQMYQEKNQIDVKDIMEILKRKQQIMEAFEKQQEIIKKFSELSDSIPEKEKNKGKNLISDLASLLEQLLVIDHENEKLLRNLMSTRQPSGKSRTNLRERPALQPQLPFIPNRPAAAPVKNTPAMQKTPAGNPNTIRKPDNKPDTEKTTPAQTAQRIRQNTEKSRTNSTIRDYVPSRYTPKSSLKSYANAQLLQLASKYA